MRTPFRLVWLLRLVSLPALAVAVAAGAVAQEGFAPARIEQVQFIPPRFTVGDQVELQVVLVGLIDHGHGTPRPAAGPAAALEPIMVDAVTVAPLAGGRHLLSVSFRSFQPGTVSLPAIDLGGAVVELPAVTTTATLPAGVGELEPSRAPMALPGTVAGLVAAGALLLICPAAAAIGARRVARVASRLLAAGRRRGPRLRFERDLRALKGRGTSGAAYSAEVARLTRRFLTGRLQVAARSKTAPELTALLADAGLTPQAAAAVTGAIAATERFTFGGAPLRYTDAAALADQARAAVSAAERDLDEG
ncbi:MAG: hypothetical protein OXQ31_18080 [Spirochaetaceae bacterium]|nr:hypothetical protein [Spirochaetaceae bacterium]